MSDLVTITAYSEPDYDGWGPDSYWSMDHWKRFYSALKKEFGAKEAKSRFIAAYRDPSAPEFGVARAGYLSDSSFSKWLKDRGLWAEINTGLNGVATNILLGGEKVANNVAEGAGSLSDGVSMTAKTLKYLLPVILIILLFLGYKFLQKRFST